jgi:signal transduction histidine kinase
MRDVTEIHNLAKLKSEAAIFSLYTSTISHEMLTPLKNMIYVSNALEEEFPESSNLKKSARLIKISSQMLLTQIKT